MFNHKQNDVKILNILGDTKPNQRKRLIASTETILDISLWRYIDIRTLSPSASPLSSA